MPDCRSKHDKYVDWRSRIALRCLCNELLKKFREVKPTKIDANIIPEWMDALQTTKRAMEEIFPFLLRKNYDEFYMRFTNGMDCYVSGKGCKYENIWLKSAHDKFCQSVSGELNCMLQRFQILFRATITNISKESITSLAGKVYSLITNEQGNLNSLTHRASSETQRKTQTRDKSKTTQKTKTTAKR